jgi:hypothetical protein
MMALKPANKPKIPLKKHHIASHMVVALDATESFRALAHQ